MILLACAVEKELRPWMRRDGVETLITGVGPVEAGCAIAHALAGTQYRLVINAGIAGAFEGAATIGDGVIVAEESYELSLENGDALALPGGQRVVDSTRSDPALVARLAKAGFPPVRGITVSRVTSSEMTAQRLSQLGAHVESMEGFAVLRAAERAGVAAIELRGISNRAGSRERSGWDFEAGVAGMQSALLALYHLLDTDDGTTTTR